MTDAAATPSAEWQVVPTDAGPVTLATLDQLEARVTQWRNWIAESTTMARLLRSQADDHLAAAGAVLVARAADWPVPADLKATVEQAQAIRARIAADDSSVAALKDQEASAGILARVGVRHHEHQVLHDRDTAATQVRALLIPIARSAPSTGIAEAEAERKSASDLEVQASNLETQIQAAQARDSSRDEEIARRKSAINEMGFDSLFEAAVLQTSGAPSVDSPLLLKRGEQAYLSVAATLARMVSKTHYVGGSSGFSFPIGHTGIRYRVGSFRGQPVSQQSLTRLDTGEFVVTNQRVAYVGRTKSVSVQLEKILHVEVYNDAISIAREGKENPDFYLMASPKHAVFLINWVLSKLTDRGN